MHYRPPGRSAHRIVPRQLGTTLEGRRWNRPHRPGARPPPFSIGLLRQYLPRHVSLRDYNQDDLDDIAAELNGRPRQTLAFE
jgi:hypothetical protein